MKTCLVPSDRPRGPDHPGADNPIDRPDERRELWRASHPRDPLTADEVATHRKMARGELRWDGGEWVESKPYGHVLRRDLGDRMRAEVDLGEKVRELPNARDVLPNLNRAEIDSRKFAVYSLNPDHPKNGGKAAGWRALGYDVDDPEARQEAAYDLTDLIYGELLPQGKVARTEPLPDGVRYRVVNGFIGPNERHGTLVTGWLVVDEGDRSHPKLTTAWVQPLRRNGTDDGIRQDR